MKRVLAAAAGVTLVGVVGIGAASAATGSGPGDRVADALAGLVRSGTITEEQATAVGDALRDAADEARAERQERLAQRQAAVDTLLQETLGLSRDEVREQLRSGRTLEEIAGDRADELAAGLVDLVERGTADAVADGRLTQAQADEIIDRAEQRAADWLAGEDVGPGHGLGLGRLLGGGTGMGPGGFGHGGWGQGAGTDGQTATT